MYKFFMLISTTFYGELSQNAGDNCSKPDNTYYIYYYVFKPKQTFRKLKKELMVIIIVAFQINKNADQKLSNDGNKNV